MLIEQFAKVKNQEKETQVSKPISLLNKWDEQNLKGGGVIIG